MRNSAKISFSINIAFVQSALSRVTLPRKDIDRILYECRIPRQLLNEPDARVSLVQHAELLSALMKATNDELLGHANEPLPLGSLALLTHWLVAAKTIEQVLKRFVRFHQILGKGQRINTHIEENRVYIQYEHKPKTTNTDRFMAEFSFFIVHRILCWLRKEIIPIDHVEFPFEKPAYARDYGLMFYGAPVSFNCKRTSISFPRSLLEKPVQQNLPNLEKFLKDPNFELLVLNFNPDNWASKVVSEIRDQLDALPTLPELATMMNLKPYTLQRKLAKEDTTYLAIKNQLKRDAAIEFLVNTTISVEEISVRLGFSETSSFTRTFKDWTGIPPSEYRKYL